MISWPQESSKLNEKEVENITARVHRISAFLQLRLVHRSTELHHFWRVLSAESKERAIGPVLACNELEVRRAAVLCHANHVDCFESALIPIDIVMYGLLFALLNLRFSLC
jgi:hypothetical protein